MEVEKEKATEIVGRSTTDQDDALSIRTREWIFASVALFAIFGAFALFSAIFLVFVWPRSSEWALSALLVARFRSIVGVPMAAIASFVIVWAFSVTQGHIEATGFGLSFKGASGPIIFWIFVFLAIVTGINISW